MRLCVLEAQDIALHPMVRCRDLPDALRLSGLHNTFSPAVFTPHTQKAPSVRMGFSTLFDAWQFPTLAWETPHYHRRYGVSLLKFGMGSGGTTALQPPGKFCY